MRTLLIVDDQPSVLIALEYAFRACGFDVLTAGCGETALTMLENLPIDAALVDVKMPGMDGLSLSRALTHAAVNGRPLSGVWLMTALPPSETTPEEVGARGLFRKPFDFADVAAEIRAALDGASPAWN